MGASAPGRTWVGSLKRLHRGMLRFVAPVLLFAILFTWLMRELEERTFFVAPWLEAGAVRAVTREREEGSAATAAARHTERCVGAAELDALAQVYAEWLWRAGFRRVVPGVADDVRRALLGQAPQQSLDSLLLRYLERWPRHEEPWEPWES
jgi:Na+-transporting methylmalonyl-CoA/oxaloacetate decarboxylase gamma subunit